MIRILLLLTLLVPMAQAQQTLHPLYSHNRILLIFAPSDQDPRYTQQLTLLAPHSADMKQRDLLLLPVLAHPRPAPTAQAVDSALRPLPDNEATRARHRFHVAPTEFAAILVGKDGGEKFRSDTPVSIEHLSQLIDAMPMRQEEMRKQQTPRTAH